MQKSKSAQTKNLINKKNFTQPKERLCESIFAYSVNRSSTYLRTPVGAVSLSACVSQRLQRVEKYFFDTLYPVCISNRGVVLYPSVFLIPKNNLKKPASILGVLQTTIFIICTSLSAKEHQPYSQCNEQQ